MFPCEVTKKCAMQFAGVMLMLIGLQQMIKPELQWDLGFYPAGTTGKTENMWLMTLRCFGGCLFQAGLSLLGKVPEGAIANGIITIACVYYHAKFTSLPPLAIGVMLIVAGALNVECDQCCGGLFKGLCGGGADRDGSESDASSVKPKRKTTRKSKK